MKPSPVRFASCQVDDLPSGAVVVVSDRDHRVNNYVKSFIVSASGWHLPFSASVDVRFDVLGVSQDDIPVNTQFSDFPLFCAAGGIEWERQ